LGITRFGWIGRISIAPAFIHSNIFGNWILGLVLKRTRKREDAKEKREEILFKIFFRGISWRPGALAFSSSSFGLK
jgi:hypothetical protein